MIGKFMRILARYQGRYALSVICRYSVLSAVPLLSKFGDGNGKLKDLEPVDLTRSMLLKNASVATVSSASALLTQSAQFLLEVLDSYENALDRLSKLVELQIQVIGNEYKEQRVWDNVMAVRLQVQDLKEQKQELDIVYSCAMRSLQAVAEAAHITGAQYAGAAANEHIYSANVQLTSKQAEVESQEANLRTLEAKLIEEMSKKAEDHEDVVDDQANQKSPS